MKLAKLTQALFGKKQKRLMKEFIRCPQCDTLYALYAHVDTNYLSAVNCGTCSTAFDGVAHRSKPRSKIKIPKKINPFQARLSRLATLHAPKGQEKAAIIENPDILSAEDLDWDLEEVASETVRINSQDDFQYETRIEKNDLPQDVLLTFTKNETVPEISPADLNSYPLNIPKSRKTKRSSWIYALIALLFAINLAVVAAFWLNQDALAQNADTRPWLMMICKQIDCIVPVYSDPSKMTIQQHQLVADPLNPEHLQLHALIQNEGPFTQSLAKLKMDIDNLQGKQIDSFIFTPLQYAPNNPNLLLEPGKTLHISMNITQSPPEIFSYELKFIQ